MSRKPRPDAKLHNLPLEQQAELCDWLLGGLGYAAVRAMVAKEFKVSTSVGALHDFYHSFCVPELARQRVTARDSAASVAQDARESPGEWNEAALEKLEQYAFELMLLPGADPKHVKSIFSMVFKKGDAERAKEAAALKRERIDLDREKVELEKRKVALMEQKAAAADAAKLEVAKLRDPSAGLTDADRQAIIDKVDEILGLKN